MCEQENPMVDSLEERVLRQVGQQLGPVEAPADADLDAAIARGIRQGITRKQRRRRSRAAAIAACAVLFAGLVSVRFSPTVAAYVGQLPLLKPLVEMIHSDKGLKLAFENDFFQPIGATQNFDGTTVTVDGLIADESRILLFLSVDNAPASVHFLHNVIFRNGEGNIFKGVGVSYGQLVMEEKGSKQRGQIDLMFQEGEKLPDALQMELELGGGDPKLPSSGPVWKLNIPINKSIFAGKQQVYDLNETVVLDGQRITFGRMTVFPTRIGVEVEYDPSNSKRIFSLGNIRIEDEKGEAFGNGANGLISSHYDENHAILYFQSNYFLKPKHLFLKADGIRGLDKSQIEVQVDLQQKKLLQTPDERLSLIDVVDTGDNILLEFRVSLGMEDKMGSVFSWSFKDATGTKFDLNMMGDKQYDFNGSNQHKLQYFLPKENYQSPLTMTITDYPVRFQEDSIHIKIK